MIRIVAAVVAAGLLAPAAYAQDRPAIFPTRDVDVVYRLPQPDAAPGARALEQRMRYSANGQKQRVDPPTAGLYVIMDFAAHRMSTIRTDARMVLDMPTSAAAGTAAPASGAPFTRKGEASVAGVACTDWLTRDASGEAAEVCLTQDGVLLRAIAAGRVLVEATSVRYETQGPEVFAIPDGFKRIAAPATSAK